MTTLAAALKAAHTERNRFIACAFAVAELVVEINENGDILFAAGAAESMFGISNDKLTGKNFYNLIKSEDRIGLRQAVAGLAPGKKMTSRTITAQPSVGLARMLKTGAYRLLTDPGLAYLAISLQRADPALQASAQPGNNAASGSPAATARDAATGLATKEAFADAICAHAASLKDSGETSSLTMVDMGALEDVRPHLEDGAEEAIFAKVGALLNSNSLHTDGGGRVDRDKMGFLHNPSLGIDAIANSVEKLVREASPWADEFKVATAIVTIDSDNLSEENMCQAMLYTLNSFSESSGGNVNFGSLSEGCKAMLSETVGWQQRIKRTIADDAFTLVYQPIVDLSDGQAHHYEVLTRLNDDPKASPYKFITMAEQLGKIAEFDWAVMERAFKVLRKAGPERVVSIAVNISGRLPRGTGICPLRDLSN